MKTLNEIRQCLKPVEMPENFTNIVELEKVKDILAYSDLLKSEFEQTFRFINNLKTPHLSVIISNLFKTIGAETNAQITPYDSALSDEDLEAVIKNANNMINWKMWQTLENSLNLPELSHKLESIFNLDSHFESKVFLKNNGAKEAIDFNSENITQIFDYIHSLLSIDSVVGQVKEFSKYLIFDFMENGNVLIKYDSKKCRETFKREEMARFFKLKAYHLGFVLGGLLLSRGGLKNETLYKSLSVFTLEEDGIEWVESKDYYGLNLNKEMGDLFKELTGLNKETV